MCSCDAQVVYKEHDLCEEYCKAKTGYSFINKRQIANLYRKCKADCYYKRMFDDEDEDAEKINKN